MNRFKGIPKLPKQMNTKKKTEHRFSNTTKMPQIPLMPQKQFTKKLIKQHQPQ